MNTEEREVVEDMLRSLGEVTIRWCRKMEDPVNAVHGDITLVADDFEQHAWRVSQKFNKLCERLSEASEDSSAMPSLARAWEKGYSAGWADSGDTATGSDAPETQNPYAPGADR